MCLCVCVCVCVCDGRRVPHSHRSPAGTEIHRHCNRATTLEPDRHFARLAASSLTFSLARPACFCTVFANTSPLLSAILLSEPSTITGRQASLLDTADSTTRLPAPAAATSACLAGRRLAPPPAPQRPPTAVPSLGRRPHSSPLASAQAFSASLAPRKNESQRPTSGRNQVRRTTTKILVNTASHCSILSLFFFYRAP